MEVVGVVGAAKDLFWNRSSSRVDVHLPGN